MLGSPCLCLPVHHLPGVGAVHDIVQLQLHRLHLLHDDLHGDPKRPKWKRSCNLFFKWFQDKDWLIGEHSGRKARWKMSVHLLVAWQPEAVFWTVHFLNGGGGGGVATTLSSSSISRILISPTSALISSFSSSASVWLTLFWISSYLWSASSHLFCISSSSSSSFFILFYRPGMPCSPSLSSTGPFRQQQSCRAC